MFLKSLVIAAAIAASSVPLAGSSFARDGGSQGGGGQGGGGQGGGASAGGGSNPGGGNGSASVDIVARVPDSVNRVPNRQPPTIIVRSRAQPLPHCSTLMLPSSLSSCTTQ